MKDYQSEPAKMPKTVRHWFEKVGIYPSKAYGLHRRWRYGFYGSTRKRRFTDGTRDGVRNFRMLPHLNRLDICDGFFDRWANSTAASVPMPKTEAQFIAALETLIERSKHRVRDTHAV